jgi:hypothetical protein
VDRSRAWRPQGLHRLCTQPAGLPAESPRTNPQQRSRYVPGTRSCMHERWTMQRRQKPLQSEPCSKYARRPDQGVLNSATLQRKNTRRAPVQVPASRHVSKKHACCQSSATNRRHYMPEQSHSCRHHHAHFAPEQPVWHAAGTAANPGHNQTAAAWWSRQVWTLFTAPGVMADRAGSDPLPAL